MERWIELHDSEQGIEIEFHQSGEPAAMSARVSWSKLQEQSEQWIKFGAVVVQVEQLIV